MIVTVVVSNLRLILQPLPFDELLGMGTEKGITKVGWKKDLRKYLDEQVSQAEARRSVATRVEVKAVVILVNRLLH